MNWFNKQRWLNSRRGVTAIAWLTFFDGLLTIVKPIEERLPDKLSDLLQPINIPAFNSILLTVTGLSLMYLGLELGRRKFSAWLLALILSAINFGLHMAINPNLLQIGFSLLPVITLVASRRWFDAKLRLENIWQALRVLGFSLVFSLAYGTIGFWLLDKKDFGRTFSIGQAFARTIRSYLLIGNSDLQPRTIYGRWFLHSIAIVGVLVLAFSLVSLFRPLRQRLRVKPGERAKAKALLEKYGGETDDFFKLWPPDKSYFFSEDGRAFLAYGVARGVAVCFAGPVGKPGSVPQLLRQFKSFCQTNGLVPVFAQATDRFGKQLKAAGFRDLVIGADAIIDIAKFNQQTSRNKYFRNINNRFERAGYDGQWLSPPHSAELISQIKSVSQDWQQRAGRKQWRFFTGHYAVQYLQQTPLYVLKNKSGQIISFVNILPSYTTGEATIDLMRSRQALPNAIDFLFIRLLAELKKRGYQHFNLGLSPQAASFFADSPSERLIARLYSADQKIISFKGLHQYKSKFEPHWQPRYLYYYGRSARLPQIGLAVAKLIKY